MPALQRRRAAMFDCWQPSRLESCLPFHDRPVGMVAFAAAKRRGRPRGSEAHRELRAEARAVADAARAVGPSHADVGARLRACKSAKKHMANAAAQASSAVALEPRDEDILRFLAA